MKLVINICVILLFSILQVCSAQDFRTSEDNNAFILSKLSVNDTRVTNAAELYEAGKQNEAIQEIAEYFSERVRERYFFSWRNFAEQFDEYKILFPTKLGTHKRRAFEMMELYNPNNDWNLPMKSKSGDDISAYEFRHLARQHKAMDIAFIYRNEEDNEAYLDFIMDMVNSLEKAYINNSYEMKGNGVFESFRAGYRVFNWLFVFNLLCSSSEFSSVQKFQFIKTFYYHAFELQKSTKKFRYGNHHTKGLMALALISMIFSEFNESSQWFKQAIELLTEHLRKEINEDGFQFERSIHYHIGDIDNYFYVYYMAKINGIQLPKEFESTLFKMFEALTKLAYPNKTLPVLQDDTDSPWAEYNNLTNVMTLGTILFKEPSFRYFANSSVSSTKYWFVKEDDKNELKSLSSSTPELTSTSLPETGYYIMRNGWDEDDIVITISAGLSEFKPDHQHGDMLGLQLYASENYMLPNYQVRYYLNEYYYFKNSFVKNVCIVDSIPQGGEWRPNKGGSGFGKFLSLPEPKVDSYFASSEVDVFIGKLNYAEATFKRKIIFIKDGFALVDDKLSSHKPRSYQQIWQGFFSKENNSHLRASFANGSGLDLIQLGEFKGFLSSPIVRGKGSVIFYSDSLLSHRYLTLLHPFKEFDTRIDERKPIDQALIAGWMMKEDKFVSSGYSIIGDRIFYNDRYLLILGATKISELQLVGVKPDVFVDILNNSVILLEKEKVKFVGNKSVLALDPFKETSIREFLK